MPRAVLGVFVSQLVDDVGGHGRAQEGGHPGFLFDFVAERVDVVSLGLWFRFFFVFGPGDLDPFACYGLRVGDEASFPARESDEFFDDGGDCDAVRVCVVDYDADGGEREGDGDGADGWGLGF